MIYIKTIVTVFITLLTIYCFLPYIKDIVKGKTKPHIYTWIIFTITSAIAFVSNVYGGGVYGSIPLGIVILFNIAIVFLSLKHGTKNIDKKDRVLMSLALLSIIVWYVFNNPFVSVLMATIVDALGYVPTFRKTWSNPENETASFWFMIGLSQFLTIFTNSSYNFYTCFYLIIVCIFSWSVFLICRFRKSI